MSASAWEPALYRHVRERHGAAAARALCARFGGTVVSVPSAARERHRIAQACGIAVLQTLVADFGGCKVYVPIGPTGARARIRTDVIARLRDGQTVTQVARALGITESSVRRIRSRAAG